ncbi:hypothetical protein R1sor_016290 [Riccia sorocarpa]|uniref:Uncharacterized protein n=1 Tax=Riccia sorocarpa TaxID=122646 RepID=A0ABD3HIQ2_9MARC
MHTLHCFELASGAKLNLSKTTIIPIGEQQVPSWLTDMECNVATPSDRFRYLGILTGVDVIDQEILQDIQRRYQARLSHWSNKLLNWPEKILLAHSILQALPVYTMMAIGMSKQGMVAVEKLIRVWGANPAGRNKKPLIAWETFTKSKKDGGLGWPPLQEMAEALLLKNATKLLQRGSEDWIKVAQALFQHALQASRHTREVKSWSTTQAMLGLNSLNMPHSETFGRMLKAWFKEEKDFHKLCKDAKITNTRQLQRRDRRRISIRQLCTERNVHISHTQEAVLDKLEALLPIEDMEDIHWDQAADKDRTISQASGEPIIRVIDCVLTKHNENQAPLLLLLTMWRSSWRERNQLQFNQRRSYMPVTAILNEINEEVEALTVGNLTDKQRRQIVDAMTLIEYWKDESRRWLTGATEQTSFQLYLMRKQSTTTPTNTQTLQHNSQAPWIEAEMIHWDRLHNQGQDTNGHYQTEGSRHTNTRGAQTSRRRTRPRRRRTPETDRTRPNTTFTLSTQDCQWLNDTWQLNPRDLSPMHEDRDSHTPQRAGLDITREDHWISFDTVDVLLRQLGAM